MGFTALIAVGSLLVSLFRPRTTADKVDALERRIVVLENDAARAKGAAEERAARELARGNEMNSQLLQALHAQLGQPTGGHPTPAPMSLPPNR